MSRFFTFSGYEKISDFVTGFDDVILQSDLPPFKKGEMFDNAYIDCVNGVFVLQRKEENQEWRYDIDFLNPGTLIFKKHSTF